MIKYILILLCAMLCASLQAATTLPIEGPGLTEPIISYNTGVWHYQYTVSSQPLDGKHDISHVSISLCNSANIFNMFANAPYTAEVTATTFKWDSITPVGSTFVFGFDSLNPPALVDMTMKAATDNYTFTITGPACHPGGDQLPEPTAAIMLGFSALTLLRRKR